MKQINLFAKTIGVYEDANNQNIKESLFKKCCLIKEQFKKGGEGWLEKSLYNTHGTYDITNDPLFDNLLNWIKECVINYCNNLNYKNKITKTTGWFNIYEKGDYQECHEHSLSHISAIYCLKGDNESAKIFFKNTTNMFPIPIKEYTDFNSEYYWVPFIEGKLYLFESCLTHYIEKHNLDNLRTSLAYYFKIQ